MSLPEFSGPITLELPSDPAVLFLLRGLVERIAERLGFERRDTERMVLAADEACANVIRHAYKGKVDERLIVTFVVKTETFEITIRDFGEPKDPEAFQPRDLSEVRPGGLGMHFIRCAVDEAHYEHPADGGTLLRLIKRRPQSGAVV
ncbi:MAG: ATP-binding protein [Syntrophobacteraceae bacterium]